MKNSKLNEITTTSSVGGAYEMPFGAKTMKKKVKNVFNNAFHLDGTPDMDLADGGMMGGDGGGMGESELIESIARKILIEKFVYKASDIPNVKNRENLEGVKEVESNNLEGMDVINNNRKPTRDETIEATAYGMLDLYYEGDVSEKFIQMNKKEFLKGDNTQNVGNAAPSDFVAKQMMDDAKLRDENAAEKKFKDAVQLGSDIHFVKGINQKYKQTMVESKIVYEKIEFTNLGKIDYKLLQEKVKKLPKKYKQDNKIIFIEDAAQNRFKLVYEGSEKHGEFVLVEEKNLITESNNNAKREKLIDFDGDGVQSSRIDENLMFKNILKRATRNV